MTDGIKLALKGDKDVIAAFKDLRDYLPKQLLRTAMRKAAQVMLNAIAPHVPHLTGRLASNIVIKTKRTENTIRGRVAVNTVGDRSNSKNAFYWRFLEKGWRTKSGEHKHPFASAAIESSQQAAAQQVIDAVGDAIDRAEKKARASRGF
jgi:HK97 gp10 family phage protein